MNIQIIQVPYDSGQRSLRTGRGPEHFLQHGIDQTLRDDGHQVASTCIESQAPVTAEIATTFELNRLLAEQVSSAIGRKKFPIVLAGNCDSCVGTLAGLGQDRLGIVWFDAHGDFNTPETTVSGFLDGMALAMATGRCWQSLLGTIPRFNPIPEANVVHIGARDLDSAEKQLFQRSGVEVVRPGEGEKPLRSAVDAAFNHLRNKVARIYVHVDMDVLDMGEALPNRFAVPGGLSVELAEELIGMIKERFEVCAGAITSFDPAYDRDDQVLKAGIRLAQAFAA